MSIVTYDDLDTPVFELDTMRYLFRDGLQGMWIDFLPDYAFADTDLTTPANPGEGIAGYVDRSGNGYDGTQPVITARPIFRVGPPRAEYDGADDVLPSSLTIPSISEGCFILVGTNGIWIDNEWTNTSGTLSVGPTTYTGGPAGILPVVGDVLSIIVRDEPLTAQERQKVIQAGVKRGSAGLIELGPEQKQNYLFPGSPGRAEYISEGDYFRIERSGSSIGMVSYEIEPTPALYLAQYEWLSGSTVGVRDNASVMSGYEVSAVDPLRNVVLSVATGSLRFYHGSTEAESTFRVISLRRLIMPGETP